MEPLDGLFGGRQVIDTVGLLENGFGSLGWVSGSPVVTVLGERDTIPTVVVANPYQDGFTLAGDEDIVFLMDGDTVCCKDGDGAIVGQFAYAHEGVREVLEGVSFGCCGREPFEWESGLVGGAADVAIGHSYLFGGGSEDRESGGEAVVLVDVMAVGPGVIGDGWDVIDGEVSDEGLVVEADTVGLEERVIGAAECSGESIPGSAAILEDGNWFGWR
jgi:hypothetical protein